MNYIVNKNDSPAPYPILAIPGLGNPGEIWITTWKTLGYILLQYFFLIKETSLYRETKFDPPPPPLRLNYLFQMLGTLQLLDSDDEIFFSPALSFRDFYAAVNV